MKRYVNIAFWIFISIYFFVVLSFVSSRHKKAICTHINVIYTDTLEHHFVSKNDIIKFIDEKNEKVIGKPMSQLNIAKLENIILEQAYIKSAEVYSSINGVLNVKIAQRMPVLRIINKKNQGFYIDNEAYILPLSKKVFLRMLVASGNISYEPNFNTTESVFNNQNNSTDTKVLQDLLTLASYINNNEFWKAQIQQIYVNNNNEFELVPLVGSQIIYFGNIDNYQKKFRNLKAIYKKGFLYKGWNKYKSINLKYENQVICEKKYNP